MTRIIADLRRGGWTITDEDIPFLGRYVTPGVKRFGEYGLDPTANREPSIQQILSRRKRPVAKDASPARKKEA